MVLDSFESDLNKNLEKKEGKSLKKENSILENFKKKPYCICFLLCCFCPKLACNNCLKSCRLTINNRIG